MYLPEDSQIIIAALRSKITRLTNERDDAQASVTELEEQNAKCTVDGVMHFVSDRHFKDTMDLSLAYRTQRDEARERIDELQSQRDEALERMNENADKCTEALAKLAQYESQEDPDLALARKIAGALYRKWNVLSQAQKIDAGEDDANGYVQSALAGIKAGRVEGGSHGGSVLVEYGE